MKIDHVVLAEGAAADVRGALTLVGFNQRVINVPAIPFTFKQVLIVSFVVMPGEEPSAGTISVTLLTPSGGTGFALTHPIPAAVQPAKDVPAIGNLALELPITGDEPGTYEVHVTWQAPNKQPESRQIPIYVNSAAAQ